MSDQFDPDAYLAEDFNPDDYLAESAPMPEPEGERSKAKSFFDAATQSAAFGFGDELAGITEAAGRALGLEGVGGDIADIEIAKDGPTLSLQKLLDAYKSGRNKTRESLAKSREDNPMTSIAGDIAGGLATGSAVAKGAKALAGAGKISQGAARGLDVALGTGATGIKQMGAAGLAGGALYGAGQSEADSLGQLGKDIAEGAAYGGAFGVLIPSAMYGMKNLGKHIKDLDVFEDTIDSFRYGKMGDKLGSQKARQTLGLELIDETADSIKKLYMATKESGEAISNLIEQAEKSGNMIDMEPLLAKYAQRVDDFAKEAMDQGYDKEAAELMEPIMRLLKGQKVVKFIPKQTIKRLTEKQKVLNKMRLKREMLKNKVSNAKTQANKAMEKKIGMDDVAQTPRGINETEAPGMLYDEVADEFGNKYKRAFSGESRDYDEILQTAKQMGVDPNDVLDPEDLPKYIERMKTGNFTPVRMAKDRNGNEFAWFMDKDSGKKYMSYIPEEKMAQFTPLQKITTREGATPGAVYPSKAQKFKKIMGAKRYGAVAIPAKIETPEGVKLTKEIYDEVDDLIGQTVGYENYKTANKTFQTYAEAFEELGLDRADILDNHGDIKIDSVISVIRNIQKLEKESGSGDLARKMVGNLIKKVEAVNKPLAKEMKNKLHDVARRLELSDQMVAGLNYGLFGPVKQVLFNIANIAGLGSREVMNGLRDATPETLKKLSGVIQKEYGEYGVRLANVLREMANKDHGSRKAVLFGILQNPVYRDMLGLGEEEE